MAGIVACHRHDGAGTGSRCKRIQAQAGYARALDDASADFYASTGALALAMLALLHGMVWHRQRQRWALVFALCMALSALYFLFDPWLRPVGDQANVAGSLLGAMMILGLLVAMVDYVGLPTRVARWLLAAAVGLGLLLLALRLSGLMPRSGGFLSYALYFVVLAAAARGMQREPGGHGPLLALLSYPAAVASALLGHLPVGFAARSWCPPHAKYGADHRQSERAAAEQEVQRRRDAEADLRGSTIHSSSAWPSAPPSCRPWWRRWRASTATCRMTCAARWAAWRKPCG
jgi:hypothetical protein